MRLRSVENRLFALLVLFVTLGFAWMIRGYLLPIFWAVVLSVLFTPLFRWLKAALWGRGIPAALLTMLCIFFVIVVPIVLIGGAVTNEAVGLYSRVSTGQIDLEEPVRQVEALLPRLSLEADRLGLDFERIRTSVEGAALRTSQTVAAQLLALGQQALTFTLLLAVTFYVLFFFLKDGERLRRTLIRALPLGDAREERLLDRLALVTRATVKGTFVVAVVQGTIGGVTFALLGVAAPVLWGVVMGILSLIPAVGTGLVWLPAALILMALGQVTEGIILLVVGAAIIGSVDNILRPILVGRDAGVPDYLILLATLGGIGVFGVSGLVVGPIVAGLFLTVWRIFTEEFAAADAPEPAALVEERADVPGEVPDAAFAGSPEEAIAQTVEAAVTHASSRRPPLPPVSDI